MKLLSTFVTIFGLVKAQLPEIGYELVTSAKQCREECISSPENIYCYYGSAIGGYCCSSRDDPHCMHGSYCTRGVSDFKLKEWMCDSYASDAKGITKVDKA